MQQNSDILASRNRAGADELQNRATEPGFEEGLPPENPDGHDPLDPQIPPEIDDPNGVPGKDVPDWDDAPSPGETPPEIDEPGRVPGEDVPDIEVPPPGVPDDEPDQELPGDPPLDPEAPRG